MLAWRKYSVTKRKEFSKLGGRFVPQNVVINPGTQVIWFNGDVGHEHNIVVTDESNSQVFETGEFTELQASRPFMFNNTGNFEYADTVEYEGGFVMTGTITVDDEKGLQQQMLLQIPLWVALIQLEH
jgi:plastocyanin